MTHPIFPEGNQKAEPLMSEQTYEALRRGPANAPDVPRLSLQDAMNDLETEIDALKSALTYLTPYMEMPKMTEAPRNAVNRIARWTNEVRIMQQRVEAITQVVGGPI